MKNQMDSRNRDAKAILADLAALGTDPCRLVVVGSRTLDPEATADALVDQWSSIVSLVGFEPRRVITGCALGGSEKAARLAARRVTGKLAAVFHRPTTVANAKTAEMFMNILLSRAGDAALVLTTGWMTCKNLRLSMAEWGRKTYEAEVG